MAFSSLALSEEQFQCSICLDVFTEPVSIPCGHSYCKACIRGYWETAELCQCPLCKETFDKKPKLCVNTFISEMVVQLKALAPVEAAPLTPGQAQHTNLGEVPCDVCPKGECKAFKSCLVCLASYCEPHLAHHRIVQSLRKHKLIDPVANLSERVCKKHERPLERFCRSDLISVCKFCTEADHKTHNTVPVEEELGKRKAEMERTMCEVRKMIQERQQKVKKIEQEVELSKNDAEKEMANGILVFTALMQSIEKNQAEHLRGIQDKKKAAEKLAERLIGKLENEISELQMRSTELEQLSNTEDLLLLQSPPSFCTTLPDTKNWSKINIHTGLYVGTLRRAVCLLKEPLNKEMEKLSAVELRKAQQCAVDVTLDPDTAHPCLVLSKDGRQVSHGQTRQNLPAKRERFDNNTRVLGKQGFSSGRFYYEVQVEGKQRWVLGVARESIARKNCDISPSPADGYWTVGQWDITEYRAYTGPWVKLCPREKPKKVGVFVNYEEGQVFFYNVEAESLIYSFVGCTFTEKLLPFFSLGQCTVPLVISSLMSY